MNELDSQTRISRLRIALKRIIVKHVRRECVNGVERIPSPFPGTVGFQILDIGPKSDFLNFLWCALPEWLPSFTDIELWIHEFVEHTIGNLLLEMNILVPRVRFRGMPERLPITHVITCFSTYSGFGIGTYYKFIEPDQYIKKVNLTQLILNDY